MLNRFIKWLDVRFNAGAYSISARLGGYEFATMTHEFDLADVKVQHAAEVESLKRQLSFLEETIASPSKKPKRAFYTANDFINDVEPPVDEDDGIDPLANCYLTTIPDPRLAKPADSLSLLLGDPSPLNLTQEFKDDMRRFKEQQKYS